MLIKFLAIPGSPDKTFHITPVPISQLTRTPRVWTPSHPEHRRRRRGQQQSPLRAAVARGLPSASSSFRLLSVSRAFWRAAPNAYFFFIARALARPRYREEAKRRGARWEQGRSWLQCTHRRSDRDDRM